MNDVMTMMRPADAAAQRRRTLTDPGVPRPGADVEEAVLRRRSIRAFLPKPVPEPLIRRLLEVARWAPSGSNIQPWRVHVLTGKSLQAYTDGLIAAARGGEPRAMEYNYYAPKWREPYLARRRACGFGLYGAMGIAREDTAGRTRAHERNYQFFGAPAGMLFWIPSDLEHGSWLDYGMFIHTIILAAYGCGLAATAQGALGECPHVAHKMFNVGDDWKLIGGLSLGWPDPDAPVNLFQPDRIDVDEFTTWLD
jgi:nitroreductase